MSDEVVLGEGLSAEDEADIKAFATEEQPEAEEPQAENAEQETEEEPQASAEPEEEPTDEGFTFKIKGEEKTFTRDQIHHTLAREETFQKKYGAMEKSEEYKFGVLMAAAKGGDKAAQKALVAKMVEFTGAEDGDQMLSQMEEVKEELDEEKLLSDRQSKQAFEDAFEDVKEDVDYQETVDKIKTDLKSRMPEKVFKEYWDDPSTRRTMYDLQKSGRVDELFSAFEDQLVELPLLERAKIKTDSSLYGALFVEVIKSQNAKQGEGNKESSESELDAVSSGSRSRSAPAKESQPDWENMSDAEFRKAEQKMLKKLGIRA